MRSRPFLILVLLLFCFNTTFSQDTTASFRLEQISVSINKTTVDDDNTENKVGGGVSAYFYKPTTAGIRLGLGTELNQVNLHKDYEWGSGHFADGLEDINYSLLYLCLPLILKFDGDDKDPVFLHFGAGLDILVYSKMTATSHTFKWGVVGHDTSGTAISGPIYYDEKITGRADVSKVGLAYMIGIGFKIPFKKYLGIITFDFANGPKQEYGGYSYANFRQYLRVSLGIRKRS